MKADARKIERVIVDFLRRDGQPIYSIDGEYYLNTAEEDDDDDYGDQSVSLQKLSIGDLADEIAAELSE